VTVLVLLIAALQVIFQNAQPSSLMTRNKTNV